jgi:biopolymer transport protein ExbB/TolQ
MIALAMVGLAMLVAVAAVGAYWLFKNVSFKSVEKEDKND